MPAQQPTYTPQQINQIARAAIAQNSIKMEQPIFSTTYTASGTTNISAGQPVVSVVPRNVGLIKGFWVQLIATVTNGSAVQINLTDFGPANLLSQIQFNDLQNTTRIQTSGWHLALLNSAKHRRIFGSSLVAVTGEDSPINYGNNFTGQIKAPATIAAGASGTVTMWFWVPLAYGDTDLRGAVYANVVNSTMQLNLTLATAPVVDNATDSTLAVYVGNAAGSTALARISAITINVTQTYMDQLPIAGGGVLLPILDLATVYDLKNVPQTAIVPNQDFPIQYANFRDFLSTSMIYVNTAATGARTGGTDLNYLTLQSANLTNIWKKTPALQALQTRGMLGADLPPGTYFFDSRGKPISTTQYGNMQLVLNASTAGAGAYALMGYEAFAFLQTLNMAGSLAAS